MAQNTDFRIVIGFFDHPKTLKLERRLGPAGVIALLRLWEFTALNRPKGFLYDLDDEDFAVACRWAGSGRELREAFLELGWLDPEGGQGHPVHGWEDHQGYCIKVEDRTAHARMMANKSWDKKRRAAGNAAGNAASVAPYPEPDPEPSPPPPPDLPGNWGPAVDLKALFGVDTPGGGRNFKAWVVGLWKESIGRVPKHNRARDLRLRWLGGENSLVQIRAAILDPGTASAPSPPLHVLGILDQVRPKEPDPWD